MPERNLIQDSSVPSTAEPIDGADDQLRDRADDDLRQSGRDAEPDRKQARDQRETQPQCRKCPNAGHPQISVRLPSRCATGHAGPLQTRSREYKLGGSGSAKASSYRRQAPGRSHQPHRRLRGTPSPVCRSILVKNRALARLENSRAYDQHDQHRQQNVGRIGIDMPDMHLACDRREALHGSDRRIEHQPIDDVDVRCGCA